MPRIELRQLRYFLAVAEHLNFTRAAERLGIAQPPLSQQIQALEHQMGVKLFVRTQRNVALTPEGKALVRYARQVSNTVQVAADAVRAIARGEEGPLELGVIFSAISSVLPNLLPAFLKQFPNVRLRMQEMTIGEQIAALQEQRIDAGILRGPLRDDAFNTHVLIEEPFVAALPVNHRLAKAASVTLDELIQEPFVRIHPSVNGDFSSRL
ncbi:MAG: LysR family transcriptional regulator, partial [Hyphomonadaceae bacterium]